MEQWFETILKSTPGSLTNTSAICEKLNHPQNSFKSIHVAGTNGKGSVTKKCSAVLALSGFTVGTFTSPHLFDFTERIQVDFTPIVKQEFYKYAEIVKNAADELQIVPGWFDVYTVVSFLYFRDCNVQWACIEVGLGGRLDNTNVIRPEVSVIVSIGLDHVEILGDTIEKIALEKAGIIKENVACVYGATVPEAVILNQCRLKHSLPIKAELPQNQYFTYDQENSFISQTVLLYLNSQGAEIPNSAFTGLLEKMMFRMQEFTVKGKNVILDVSHNPDGFRRTFSDIKELYGEQEVYVVVGMSRGKMIRECLKVVREANKKVYFVGGRSERLVRVEELKDFDEVQAEESGDVQTILVRLLEDTEKNGVILVAGSFYLMPDAYECIKSLILASDS